MKHHAQNKPKTHHRAHGWTVGFGIFGGYVVYGGDYLIQDGIYIGGGIGLGLIGFIIPFPVAGLTIGAYF